MRKIDRVFMFMEFYFYYAIYINVVYMVFYVEIFNYYLSFIFYYFSFKYCINNIYLFLVFRVYYVIFYFCDFFLLIFKRGSFFLINLGWETFFRIVFL